MSLTFSCDGCGAGITPADLKTGRAVAHGGVHYCHRCKSRLEKHPSPLKQRPLLRPEPASEVLSKRKRFLIIGSICAGITVLAVLVAAIISSNSGAPKVEPSAALSDKGAGEAQAPPVKPSPVLPKEAPLTAAGAEDLAAVKSFLDPKAKLPDDPEKVIEIRDALSRLRRMTSGGREKYASLEEQVGKKLADLAGKAFDEAKKSSDKLRKESKYEEAKASWAQVPPAVREVDEINEKWGLEKSKVEEEARKWTDWKKFRAAIESEIEDKDPETIESARKRIDQFYAAEEYKEKYPGIWTEREEIYGRLKKLQGETVHEGEPPAKGEEASPKEEKDLAEELGRKPFLPGIPERGDNLENWAIRTLILKSDSEWSYPWSPKLEDSKNQKSYALAASNAESESVEIGMNGERWAAWELEFNVKVEKGRLLLKTRTSVRLQTFQGLPAGVHLVAGGISKATVVKGSQKPFEFDAEEFGEWTPVKVKAIGKEVSCLVKGKEEKISGKLDAGGFIFSLEPGGAARIKDIKVRYVRED